jgi:hypothetical protein
MVGNASLDSGISGAGLALQAAVTQSWMGVGEFAYKNRTLCIQYRLKAFL